MLNSKKLRVELGIVMNVKYLKISLHWACYLFYSSLSSNVNKIGCDSTFSNKKLKQKIETRFFFAKGQPQSSSLLKVELCEVFSPPIDNSASEKQV